MRKIFLLLLPFLGWIGAGAQEQLLFPQEIKPLLKTQWSQDDPYNRLCPLIDVASKKVRMKAGCGAIVMAQLMNYHRFPSMSPDGKFRYQWDLMFRSIDEPLSQNQVTSVAKLVNDCGVSAFMQYGEEASSTNLHVLLQALKRHYHYSKYAYIVTREQLGRAGGDREWCRLVYEELAGGRPVIMRGSFANDSKKGHVFIVDGCKGRKIHANMGWGGYMDGYYNLDITGYSAKQAVIVDMADSTYRPKIWDFRVATPGTLPEQIDTAAMMQYRHVKVSGVLNATDWLLLRMLGMTVTASLDLSEVAMDEMPDSALMGSRQLAYVQLPRGLKRVGRDAFRNCLSLNNVEMPPTVNRLGAGAFSGCIGLIDIDLPDGLQAIGSNAFNGCLALVEVDVPGTVTSIGNYAFAHCRNLWRLTMKGKVERMGTDITKDCPRLKN